MSRRRSWNHTLIIRRKISAISTSVFSTGTQAEIHLVCGHRIKVDDGNVSFNDLVECPDCLTATTGRRQPLSMSLKGLKKAIALRVNRRPIKETICD